MTASDQSGNKQTSATGMMQDQATHWLLRQRDGDMDVDDWEEFSLWLEADARHAEVYDAMVVADEPLANLSEVLSENGPDHSDEEPEWDAREAANDNPIRQIVPWAMATAAAFALAFFAWPASDPTIINYTTKPGEMQTIALSEDIVMTLNGDSAVAVVEGKPDVTIERGEIAFAIEMEGPSPLQVKVDDLIVTDIGTVFSVTLDDTAVQIAVAEGLVAINPDAQNTLVKAGELIEKPVNGHNFIRKQIDREIVASWREGRLEFDDTPVGVALSQIARSTGIAIDGSPEVSMESVTGSLRMSGDEEEIVESVADLLGGTAVQSEDGWIIE